jgi:hypothetical protein
MLIAHAKSVRSENISKLRLEGFTTSLVKVRMGGDGWHRLKVSCNYCRPQIVNEDYEHQAGCPNLNLPAKHSKLIKLTRDDGGYFIS